MAWRALLIANDEFQDVSIPKLGSPIADCTRLKHLLEREDVGSYQVTLCANQTSHSILQNIEDFFAVASYEDLLLVVISTHGIKDQESKLYFASSNTNVFRLMSTAVPSSFILEALNLSRAKLKVVVIDTCFSGSFSKGTYNSKSVHTVSRDDFHLKSRGSAVITASTSVQTAQESEIGGKVQSIFTKHMIDGIETGKADAAKRGFVTLDGLYEYIDLAMSGSGQTPQRNLNKLEGSVVLARNPTISLELEENITDRIRSQDRSIRSAVVDELLSIAKDDKNIRRGLALEALKSLSSDDSVVVSSTADLALRRLLSDQAQYNSNADSNITALTPSSTISENISSSNVDTNHLKSRTWNNFRTKFEWVCGLDTNALPIWIGRIIKMSAAIVLVFIIFASSRAGLYESPIWLVIFGGKDGTVLAEAPWLSPIIGLAILPAVGALALGWAYGLTPPDGSNGDKIPLLTIGGSALLGLAAWYIYAHLPDHPKIWLALAVMAALATLSWAFALCIHIRQFSDQSLRSFQLASAWAPVREHLIKWQSLLLRCVMALLVAGTLDTAAIGFWQMHEEASASGWHSPLTDVMEMSPLSALVLIALARWLLRREWPINPQSSTDRLKVMGLKVATAAVALQLALLFTLAWAVVSYALVWRVGDGGAGGGLVLAALALATNAILHSYWLSRRWSQARQGNKKA